MEITITSGSNTIETDTLTYLLNIPTFSISAVSDSVNEGGMAQFKVTSDVNPGTDSYSVRFAPTNTVGDYLDVTAGANGMPRSVEFDISSKYHCGRWILNIQALLLLTCGKLTTRIRLRGQ